VKSLHHPETWQRKYSDLVDDELNGLLDSLPDESGFRDLITDPLTRVGRGIELGAHSKPLYLLPLVVCEAVCGHYELAIPASAAMKLFIAAGEVFDDIEDADAGGSLSARFGPAIATNVATALLIMAEGAISRLKAKGVADCTITQVMEAVNSFYLTACSGQHLDLLFNSNSVISEDLYLKMASMKSATTVLCACHIGAFLGKASKELLDSFASFGHNLGMASQIANDIQGITSETDIFKAKITLPVIYALSQTVGDVHNQWELTLTKACKSDSNTKRFKDLLFKTGAIHYAVVKMELYKQNALNILDGFEKAGSNIEKLKLYLE
jgi:geranylgeranyl diphosphate synthase, type I